jgi:hypothetical protein
MNNSLMFVGMVCQIISEMLTMEKNGSNNACMHKIPAHLQSIGAPLFW